ncbi:hypothetical protein [Agrococcus jenensis]|uniref:Uncharacterized protein n=1 Tax=Agrococcus jenensis TaxID=46353 RepID=A0A3N2AQ92_9MICO|nr:hypothetical protein [Agrococcus jenensis]ROR65085.1 hypothetical protein EDD26_0444 [Agrococcus jenensis]
MPQDDPLVFALVLAVGLTFILSGSWAVISVIRDTTMAPLARLAMLAALILCFPLAAPLWLLAKSADLPAKLRAPLTVRAHI